MQKCSYMYVFVYNPEIIQRRFDVDARRRKDVIATLYLMGKSFILT